MAIMFYNYEFFNTTIIKKKCSFINVTCSKLLGILICLLYIYCTNKLNLAQTFFCLGTEICVIACNNEIIRLCTFIFYLLLNLNLIKHNQ